jgi:hypothetical protein
MKLASDHRLRKHQNISPPVAPNFSGKTLEGTLEGTWREPWSLLRAAYGMVKFETKYLGFCSDFVQHIYTHLKGQLLKDIQ